jgi:hypothetical protein
MMVDAAREIERMKTMMFVKQKDVFYFLSLSLEE